MSSVDDIEEFEPKLSLVIKKVQEGKTHICITNITNDRSRNIHIVLTMNTIASNEQFFGRMEVEIGSNRIIVFNSKKTTAGDCHHAKDVSSIFKLIRENSDIKVIVCCAHIARIRNSIPDLFIQAGEMSSFANRKFILHIDEAHKYIPENKKNIRDFNSSHIVKSIIGYSGSPNGIWAKNNPEDPLFHKILIRDIAEEFNIISSPEYFGVKRGVKHCEHIIVELEPDFDVNKMIEDANIDVNIPNFAWHYGGMSDKEHARRVWYDKCFPFDLGNEIMFLSYLEYILGRVEIPQDRFSYNFIPAYNRKVTHYQTVEIIHSKFPNANVIVINGNGMQLFRLCSSVLNPSAKSSKQIITDKDIITSSPDEHKKLLEPSYKVQMLIRGFEDCPTFITGQTCVSMSVTLINQNIGNFDNVIIAHQHLSDDKSYQLCRFLFNYARWSEENKQKIKTTRLYSLTKNFIDKCIQYEEDVEYMGSEFAGRTCSLREIQGLSPEDPSEREIKNHALMSIELHNAEKWKKFKVYDGNDEEQWTRVNAFYKDKIGKDVPSRSKPKKSNPDTREESEFYYSSTTNKLGIQLESAIKGLSSQSWHSTFQLTPNKLNYARIFVGYDSLDDSTEYTIYLKYAQLIDTPETREILNKYGKKKSSAATSSTDSTEDEEEE